MADVAIAISRDEQQRVVIDGDSVLILQLRVSDPQLFGLVSEAPNKEQAVEQCLGVGARALRGVQTSVDAAVVKTEFAELSGKLDLALEKAILAEARPCHPEQFLDPEKGELRKVVDGLKTELDRSLGETFDPESKKSALAKLEDIFAKATNGQADIVRDLVDPGNPKSPLGRLRGEMAKELKDLRDTVGRLQTHLAVEEAKDNVMELTAVKGCALRTRSSSR